MKFFAEVFIYRANVLRSDTVLELKEVRGALLGEACGDALGYPLIHL